MSCSAAGATAGKGMDNFMGNKKTVDVSIHKHARIPTPTVIFFRARARVAVLALVLLSLVVSRRQFSERARQAHSMSCSPILS